jgi:methylmalonyl-CoA mutase N-terminal domain/subunit
MADDSKAGEFPFRSGIHKGMYATKPWTIRQYAGFGTPEQTNQKFKELIANGVTGLSVAFDLPTQMGLDPEDPIALGEVGQIGVSISNLDDMRKLLADIPLDRISISMTINATAPIIYLMYSIIAEERNYKLEELRGTIQNDILKEFISRNTYIFSPEFSMILTTNLIQYSLKNTPKWNPISISGYHMSEAGATSIQEIAFTFTNAIAYIDELISNGSTIDEIAPRLSFFFSAKLNFIEEVAKFRAARDVYARLIQDRYKPKKELSTRLRFHVQTSGAELSADKPELNLVRVSIQAIAAVLGGTQSLHTNSFDEALSLPTEFSASLAVDTQTILQRETDLCSHVDPFEGSKVVERLTDEIITGTEELIEQVHNLGGAMNAIKTGFQKSLISSEALKISLALESGDMIRVGFASDGERQNYLEKNPIHKNEKPRISHLPHNKNIDNQEVIRRALEQIAGAELAKEDILSLIREALEVDASLGQIVHALKNLEIRSYR